MEVKFKRSEPDATWAVIPGHLSEKFTTGLNDESAPAADFNKLKINNFQRMTGK